MPVGRKKTDNSNLEAKLELRRYFLRKYPGTGRPRVLDCCQGEGILWSVLRREFEVDYWGVDRKPRKGRLKVDSVRILAQPGWSQNVVDIDTYGSPWKHWFAMLPRVERDTTVFLTFGHVAIGGGAADRAMLDAMGVRFTRLEVPGSLGAKLCDLGVDYCLACARQYGLELVEIVEALPSQNARYFGVRLARRGGKTHERNGDHLDRGHLESGFGLPESQRRL